MNFWIGVFSDDGAPSFSRVASGFIMLACVAWDSILIFHNLHSPTGVYALPDFSGQCLLIAVPYGLNVTGKAIGKIAAAPEKT
jgi:hypothetical protein